jgi:hypothetical protein
MQQMNASAMVRRMITDVVSLLFFSAVFMGRAFRRPALLIKGRRAD